jgi:hypothetical protein
MTKPKPKKRKPRWKMLRWRRGDHVHNIHVAVQRWIHANGGTLVVSGGLELQDWQEGLGKYRVALRCLGRRPTP